MAEVVTFAAPIDPPRTVFRPSYVAFDLYLGLIKLHVRNWDGAAFGDRLILVTWSGAEALTMIRAIFKADLSTRTLLERLMDKALADGKLKPGTVGGVAD